MDSRQEPALGDIHHRLGACDVTLVGAGGIGSPLAETLFRMGPKSLTVLDSGFFDTTSNVRRTFNAPRANGWHLSAEAGSLWTRVAKSACRTKRWR
ncbi:MAG: ThiF family adenylyltransferase [Dehalococcoidia bacterium]|nr:ThiF family adenylyltransferase [Dehalococcoidia bacterium]